MILVEMGARSQWGRMSGEWEDVLLMKQRTFVTVFVAVTKYPDQTELKEEFILA